MPLTPAAHPELAVLPPAARTLMINLLAHPHISIGLIRLTDVITLTGGTDQAREWTAVLTEAGLLAGMDYMRIDDMWTIPDAVRHRLTRAPLPRALGVTCSAQSTHNELCGHARGLRG